MPKSLSSSGPASQNRDKSSDFCFRPLSIQPSSSDAIESTEITSGRLLKFSRSGHATTRAVVRGTVGNAPNRDLFSHDVDTQHD